MLEILRLSNCDLSMKLIGIYENGILMIGNKRSKISKREVKDRYNRGYYKIVKLDFLNID